MLGLAALIAFLYYRPVRAYLEIQSELARQRAEVRALRAKKEVLAERVSLIESEATLVRGARRLGLVKPGERLFIVKGIDAWRRAHAALDSR